VRDHEIRKVRVGAGLPKVGRLFDPQNALLQVSSTVQRRATVETGQSVIADSAG